MIDELKKNIDVEMEILKEIAVYSRKLAFAPESEAKLLRQTIDSLRKSMKTKPNTPEMAAATEILRDD